MPIYYQVVSEEHETDDWDKSAVVPLSISQSDVIELIKGDQSIPLEDVTVWVDPLDATQEYTGIDRNRVKVFWFIIGCSREDELWTQFHRAAKHKIC